METGKNTGINSFMLSAVAGFCDTATFVAGGAIFSAHVTGNFIVFAAQLARGSDSHAFQKLMTFPVFVVAVIVGGWVIRKGYPILLWQSLLLMTAGVLMFVSQSPDVIYLSVMITVLAMGLQNAFGKLFAKATHGPTTMMTGNVTQASLDLGNLLLNFKADKAVAGASLKKAAFTISGFLCGCIGGALTGNYFGLSCLLLPASALLFCYLDTRHQLYTQTVS